MIRKRYALVCDPAVSVQRGLRMRDLGLVDPALAKEQHRLYCRALERFGYTLLRLPADERFPDSVFVEDPAIIIRDLLVIARLRCLERQGEEVIVEAALRPFFSRIVRIEPPGFIEGGDVLIGEGRIAIGLSGRTNEAGADQLVRFARDVFRYEATIFRIPRHFLHLKGGVTYHRRRGERALLTVTEEIADAFARWECDVLVTPSDERFAANCISRGKKILFHAGRPRTKHLLERAGYTVVELSFSEFEKIDGAMTCLSKLFVVS